MVKFSKPLSTLACHRSSWCTFDTPRTFSFWSSATWNQAVANSCEALILCLSVRHFYNPQLKESFLYSSIILVFTSKKHPISFRSYASFCLTRNFRSLWGSQEKQCTGISIYVLLLHTEYSTLIDTSVGIIVCMSSGQQSCCVFTRLRF